MLHLTVDELIAYNNGERQKWCRWFKDNPQAMSAHVQRQGRYAGHEPPGDHDLFYSNALK